MINQNRVDSMAAVGELERCILSGQVSAAQLEAHRSAGELGGSATRMAIQLCMNQNRGVYKGMLEPLFAEQDAQVAQLSAQLEAARDAQLIEVAHLKGLLSRYRNELPVGHQPHMICHEVDAALFNTKEQSND